MSDVVSRSVAPDQDGHDQILRLKDGRALGYSTWGPRDGFPVFGFHGTPNSRLVHFGPEIPRRAEVYLVLPDRPGFGLSDPRDGRTLLDWPLDVVELAN